MNALASRSTMQPLPSVISDQDPFLQALVKCVSSIECSSYFSHHLGAMQHEQRSIVARFQAALLEHLSAEFKDEFEWMQEHCPSSETKDSIDIFGKACDRWVAIELDKNRADQVAKKFVSRMAALPSTASVYFLSVCYPGTERMNKAECVKYFGYCQELALRMGSHYAGFIIQ